MGTTDTEQLGDFVRKQRETAGLSLRAAARAAGIDHKYLFNIENGKVEQPGPRILVALARVLEVEVEDLYALAGYTMPEGLPTFEPYLRTKYGLPSEAVQQLDEYFAYLRQRYGSDENSASQAAPGDSGGGGGDGSTPASGRTGSSGRPS